MEKVVFSIVILLLIMSLVALLFQFKGFAESAANWAYVLLLLGVGKQLWNFFTKQKGRT